MMMRLCTDWNRIINVNIMLHWQSLPSIVVDCHSGVANYIFGVSVRLIAKFAYVGTRGIAWMDG